MATQAEIVAQLEAANAKIVALTAKEEAQTTQLGKIRTEIQALKDAVGGGNLDSISAALATLEGSITTLETSSAAGHAATQAADDDNPDAPTP